MRRKHYSKIPLYGLLGELQGYACPEKGIEIRRCPKGEADKVIAERHYSRKPTQNSFLSLMVYYNGVPSGAMQIGYGIRPRQKENPDQTREFDRMWLSDDMPKFSETICLSLLHRFLKAAYPNIRKLVSYADTTVGNEGVIYQAANYRLEKARKADFYVLASGERVHPVTMWHRHKTRRWEVLQGIYPGIRKAQGFQKKYSIELR